jgi:SH3 domain protein|tara:strand:+ start:134138 stop:134797 length:660 start_codon:yes stop_codon:yes gene_type:complete
MRKMLLPLFFLLASGSLHAATGWIGDDLYVPVRAGAGATYKILHRGLKTGTSVEILEMEAGNEWAKIRYGEVEGYINARYLNRTPTAGIKLEQLEKKYEQLRSQFNDSQSQLRDVTQQRDKLSGENKQLDNSLSTRQKELSTLKDVAADPIRLDQANRKLNEELVTLRTQLDTTQAENAMLRGDKTSSQWLIGCLILFAGSMVGWLLKGRSGKRNNSWA